MAELSPISWINLVSRLKKLGFDGPYRGGKHPFMIKGELVLTLPNPHRGDISIDLILRIMKQSGITRKEWLDK